MTGIRYIEKPESLAAMRKELPVFFIAGGDDPVGNYGKGVRQSADAFRKGGDGGCFRAHLPAVQA